MKFRKISFQRGHSKICHNFKERCICHDTKSFNYPDLSLNPKFGITSGEIFLNLHFLNGKSVIIPPHLTNGLLEVMREHSS